MQKSTLKFQILHYMSNSSKRKNVNLMIQHSFTFWAIQNLRGYIAWGPTPLKKWISLSNPRG